MKKVLFSLLIILIVSSCSKFKGDKKGDLVYYCEDYKEADMNILDVHTSDIDALWIEMTPEKDGKDKDYVNYTLIVKSNGDFVKESGTFETDWANSITFNPEGTPLYTGKWIYKKEKYTIKHGLESRFEELTYVYKKTECKK
jgi:hypothetical protein